MAQGSGPVAASGFFFRVAGQAGVSEQPDWFRKSAAHALGLPADLPMRSGGKRGSDDGLRGGTLLQANSRGDR